MTRLQNLCPNFFLPSMSRNARLRQWKTGSGLGGIVTCFGLVDTWIKLFTPSPQWQEESLVHMHHQGLQILKTLVLYLLRNKIAGDRSMKEQVPQGNKQLMRAPKCKHICVFRVGESVPFSCVLCMHLGPWLQGSGTPLGLPQDALPEVSPQDSSQGKDLANVLLAS